MSFEGTTAGVYREGDLLLPIIAHFPDSERAGVDSIHDVQVYRPIARRTLPIQQVVSNFEMDWEYPIICRIDRKRTLTIHCDQRTGSASVLLNAIMPKIEAIDLPPGYAIDLAGEYGDSKDVQAGLAATGGGEGGMSGPYRGTPTAPERRSGDNPEGPDLPDGGNKEGKIRGIFEISGIAPTAGPRRTEEDFLEHCKRTMAKPYRWTDTGRPLTI